MNLHKKITSILFMVIGLTISCTKDPALPLNTNTKIEISKPNLSAITQIGATATAKAEGGINGDIVDKGICWSTATNPILNSAQQKSGGSGEGSFSVNLSNLIPGTNYFVRAYSQSKNEVIYSEQVQLKTIDYQLASVTTSSVTNITLTSASAIGTVNATGGGTVTTKGFCWNTSPTPTISDSRINVAGGLGAFTADIPNLNPGITYYLRTFATNQAGTAYGNQISFTTVSIKLATVGSINITSITKNGAFATGSVTADGGGAISSKGICYSTNVNPTIISSMYNNNGTGTGTVSYSISGLQTATTYYVRAYAINSAGVSYGAQTSFKTL
ncbi:hypothetical protein ACFSR6_20730 [Pedobacter vanadiisoli]|uniref:Fibronectin type-III domain-containing protein n=1 Tax=Pedobacter vanadiisoli TaxID=1761975 RepID=A0ABW5MNX3_9SPHI